MDTDKQQYFLKVAHALEGCQSVELTIKLYLSTAYALAEKLIAGRMTFKMPIDDLDSKSLDRLIELFKTVNANAALLTDLRKFKDQRNMVAHQAISKCIYPDGTFDYTTAGELETILSSSQIESERLVLAIHEEYNKIAVRLYFDPVC